MLMVGAIGKEHLRLEANPDRAEYAEDRNTKGNTYGNGGYWILIIMLLEKTIP
jgi:hypothetical protein